MDKSSADSAEIGEALQRTASVASVAGIDFKKLSSYIATISETTRTAASVVGQSVRSMIVRFNQLREQGFNEEDTTKVNDVVQALSTIGIDAFDDSTQSLMNFSDIIEQLAPKWDTLDEKTRNYIQTSLAGNYQADKFAALMSNYTRAQELYSYALDSSGQATKKFEIYQESAQAKFEKFQLALQSLYTEILDSSALKYFIDSATDFIGVLSLSTENLSVFISNLVILGSVIAILKMESITTAIFGFSGALRSAIGIIEGTTAATTALTTEVGVLATEVTVATGGLNLILTAIVATVGALAFAWTNYSAKLEEARQKAEDFKKAQDDLNFALGEGGNSAKTKLNDIKQLSEEYEKYSNIISEISKKNQFGGASALSEGDFDKFNNAKDKVKELEEEFNKLGLTANEAKIIIEKLNKAQEENSKITESITKFDLLTKQQKELNTVENLVNSYDEWTSKKKKTKEEDEKLSAISATLASKLSDLGISYQTNAQGLIINTNGVKDLVKAKIELTNTSVSSATKEMTVEKERLSVMLKSIQTELEARKALASALAGSMTDFAKASAGERRANDLITDPLGLKRDKSLDETTSYLEGKAKQYTEAVKSFDYAINEVASKVSGSPSLLSSPDSKTTKEKAKKDPYLSTLNLQYQELERQISLTNQSLKDNQNTMSSNAETDKQKILYLEKEVELNKTLQSQYANLAKAKRAEMQSIQSKLNAFGLGVSTDKEDNITIKNWKNINSLSEDNRKIADDLISKMQSLSGEVKGYGDSWTDANNKIISDNKEIASILKNEILNTLDKQEKKMSDIISKDLEILQQKSKKDELSKKTEIDNTKEALKEYEKAKQKEIDLVKDNLKEYEKSKQKEIDLVKDNLKEYEKSKQKEIDLVKEEKDINSEKYELILNQQEEINNIITEQYDKRIEQSELDLENYEKSLEKQDDINKLVEIENDIKKENVDFSEKLNELESKRNSIINNRNVRQLNAQGTAFEFIADPSALQENTEDIEDLTKEHNDNLTDLNGQKEDEIKNQSEKAQKEALQAVIDRYKKEKEEMQKDYNIKVELINKQKDDNQKFYESKLDLLEKEKEAYSESLQNKIELLEKEKEAYSESLQNKIELLEKEKEFRVEDYNDKIDILEKELDAIKKKYDEKITALQNFQKSMQEEIGKGNIITKATQDKLFEDLNKADATYFKTTVEGYKIMVDEINSLLAQIGRSGSSSSSWLANSSKPTTNQAGNSASSKAGNTTSSSVKGSYVDTAYTVSKFHDGIESGLVGGLPIPKNYEQLALLAKKEGVFTENHMNNLSSNINSLMAKATNTVKSAGDIIIQSMTITTNNPKDFAYKMRDLRIGNS